MEREVIFLQIGNVRDASLVQKAFKLLVGCLNDGYVIDPILKIIRLENAVIYHLVKYSSEELEALEVSEKQPEIVSVKSVPIDQADTWIQQQGYQVEHLYAKSVTLVKRE